MSEFPAASSAGGSSLPNKSESSSVIAAFDFSSSTKSPSSSGAGAPALSPLCKSATTTMITPLSHTQSMRYQSPRLTNNSRQQQSMLWKDSGNSGRVLKATAITPATTTSSNSRLSHQPLVSTSPSVIPTSTTSNHPKPSKQISILVNRPSSSKYGVSAMSVKQQNFSVSTASAAANPSTTSTRSPRTSSSAISKSSTTSNVPAERFSRPATSTTHSRQSLTSSSSGSRFSRLTAEEATKQQPQQSTRGVNKSATTTSIIDHR